MKAVGIFICLFYSVISFAQIDTEFWFVAPEASNLHGDAPIYLRLAGTGQTANVTISQPANPSFSVITTTVGANGIVSINLTSSLFSIENKPPNQVLTKGLLIQSTTEISAHYEIANGFNPEIFPLKGRNALGTSFFTIGQNQFRNEFGAEAIDIVATENGTIITVVPTADIVGHTANIPFTITLNRGETFSCRATNLTAQSYLAGTKITSNKPISITISDDSLFQSGSYDIIGDQIVPISLTGTEYIAVRGLGTQELLYVLATEDNTDIFTNGSATALTTLSIGQLYKINITNASIYLQSSKPVYAYHISGHNAELGDALLPPINCTGSDRVSFVRSGNDQFSMMILTEASNQNNFTLNGGTINLNFIAVPGNPNWVAVRIDPTTNVVPVGNNVLENSTGLFHLGTLYNYDNFSSEYGYFSNYSSLNIGDDRVICQGSDIELNGGINNTDYLWSTGDTTQYITVSVQDTYSVQVNYFGCVLNDTVILNVNEINVEIGENFSMCAASDTLIIANTPNTNITYEWKDGSTGTSFFAIDTGKISLIVTDTIGCEASDSLLFSYYPIIELGNDTSFVCDSLRFELIGNIPNANYVWQDGSTDTFYTVTSDGLYWVDVIDAHNCLSTDSLFVTFVNSPVLDLGNDRTVCPDQFITFDATIPNGVGYFWQDSMETAIYTTNETGTYIVRVVDNSTCFTWDTVVISNFIVADSLFGADTILCNSEIYELIPNISNSSTFIWQDASTNPTFTITEMGTYWVDIVDLNNCSSSDTIEAGYLPGLSAINFPEDTTICTGNSILLNVYQPEATAYQWTGQSTYFGENDYESDSFKMTIAGVYEIAITSKCGTVAKSIELITEDCTCEPFVPNAFTPNNDGNNDEFKIYESCPIENAELWVFDRNGGLVHYTNQPKDGWNGLLNGKVIPNGVYVWQLTYEAENQFGVLEKQLMKGDITVVK
jgi:gliding motility-associated-like protein